MQPVLKPHRLLLRLFTLDDTDNLLGIFADPTPIFRIGPTPDTRSAMPETIPTRISHT
jgi:hypothetical protein